MTTPRPLDARAAAILTLCCVIWGVGLTMVKIANTGLPPVFNAALRSALCVSLLLGWIWWRGVDIRRPGTFWPAIFIGVSFSFEFITLYVGLTETSAARATIFLHCAPFVAAAGEHFLVPGHRLSGVRLLGLLAAFAGMTLALADTGAGTSAGSLRGDLLCLAGGVCWGLITVGVKTTALRTAPPETSLVAQLLVSVPVLFAWSYLFETRTVGPLTPAVLGAFAYTVLFVVLFGYSVWFWMMGRYSAASLHAFTFLTPVFGALAGMLILGEQVGVLTMAGLMLVAAGIWLVNRPK
jgi:drug/metabolite transporter (DMT)-like permease